MNTIVKKVLVIDSDIAFQDFLSQYFQIVPEIVVKNCFDPIDGLNVIKTENFKIIVISAEVLGKETINYIKILKHIHWQAQLFILTTNLKKSKEFEPFGVILEKITSNEMASNLVSLLQKAFNKIEDIYENIPAVQEPKQLNATHLEPKEIQEPSLTKKTILIVDDDVHIVDYLQEILKSYGAHGATTVEKAFEVIRAQACDVIITDIHMPDMDGFEFIRRIRSIDPRIPIIIITGFSNDQNKSEALKVGADGFLEKPFKRDDINAAIEQCLKHRQTFLQLTQTDLEKEKDKLEKDLRLRTIKILAMTILILGALFTLILFYSTPKYTEEDLLKEQEMRNPRNRKDEMLPVSEKKENQPATSTITFALAKEIQKEPENILEEQQQQAKPEKLQAVIEETTAVLEKSKKPIHKGQPQKKKSEKNLKAGKKGKFGVQVLSAINEDALHSYIKQHDLSEYEPFIESAIVQEKKTFRLFVGAFDSKEKAKTLQKKLKNKKNIEAIVVIRSH